jgi:hypothetical protein
MKITYKMLWHMNHYNVCYRYMTLSTKGQMLFTSSLPYATVVTCNWMEGGWDDLTNTGKKFSLELYLTHRSIVYVISNTSLNALKITKPHYTLIGLS